MKRFLSLALLALFCLFAYQAKADDITTTDDGIEITPAAGTVTSLSSIRFAHDPITPTWNSGCSETDIKVYDADGNVAAHGVTDEYDEEYSGWDPDTAITFYLNTTITEDGTYTLKVPAGFFYLAVGGTESAAIEIEYTIGEGGETEEEADITLVSPESEDGVITTEEWIGWFDDEENPTVLKFKASDEVSSSDYTLYWALNIVDGAADENYPYESYANYDSSTGLFSTEIFFTQTFYEGTTYELTACVKNSKSNATIIDEMTVLTIIGATPTDDDPRSTVSLLSSDPEYYDAQGSQHEIELESVQDLPVTLTFDGFVSITATINQSHVGETYTGNSTALSATGVKGTADSTGDYYKQWTFTIPASEIGDESYGGSISVIIEGTDSIGKLLFDSSGYTSLIYSYTITGDVEADLTDYTFTPADSATVAELDSIVIANTNGIAISWYVESFNIIDEDGEIVATISAKDDIVVNYESDEEPDENSGQKGDDSDDSWGNAYSVTITLPEAITDEGTYTVTIPSGFFVIGIGSVTTNSPKITLTYIVESTSNEDGEGEGSGSGEGEGDENGDTTGISAINAAIANGAEVYNLAGQRIAAPVSGMVNVVKYADGTVKKVLVK